MTGAVLLRGAAARAVGLPVMPLSVGAVLVSDDGATYRVTAEGALDRVVQGGRPHGGIAEDFTARVRA